MAPQHTLPYELLLQPHPIPRLQFSLRLSSCDIGFTSLSEMRDLKDSKVPWKSFQYPLLTSGFLFHQFKIPSSNGITSLVQTVVEGITLTLESKFAVAVVNPSE